MGKLSLTLMALLGCCHFLFANPSASISDFKANWIKDGEFIQLKWVTTHESDLSHFILERSTDGQNWEELNRILAEGADSTLTTYSCKDMLPLEGENYYRLRLISQNTTNEDYSFVIVVSADIDDPKWVLFPNPVEKEFFLKHPEFDPSRLEIGIWNQDGFAFDPPTVIELSGIKVDAKDLPSGAYVLRMRMNGIFQSLRFEKL